MLDRTNFGIGHNGPPSSIDLAKDTLSALADWLKDNPVIETEEAARAAKLMKDRADSAMKDLKDEHEKLYRPFKDQIDELAERYEIRDPLARIISELKARIDRFINAERLRRQAIAEAAQRVAAEKATLARLAEEAERAAAQEAAQGVCDVDIVGATVTADQAFAEYERSERAAERAQRETHVMIGGGYGKRLGQRTHEVLTITDVHAAIEDMGVTEPLQEAILTAARAYKKAIGELPDGITARQERSV